MRAAGVIAFVLIAAPALAQAPALPPLGESAQNMLGAWELTDAQRSKSCPATFRKARTSVGYRLEFGKDCAALFPLTANVAGWVFPEGNLLRLVNAEGQTLADFSEVEDGIFEAPTPGVGVLVLQSADAAAAARKSEAMPEPERIEEPQGR